MKIEDRDKIAFTTLLGNFRFKRMPFGLRNAPSSFQRLLYRIRSALKNTFLIVYTDDVEILSSYFDEHLDDRSQVFERLRLFKLHVNYAKCSFKREIARNKISWSFDLPGMNQTRCSKYKHNHGNETTRKCETAVPISAKGTVVSTICPKLLQCCQTYQTKNTPWQWGPAQDQTFVSQKMLLTTTSIL